jgi:hypothetical protein
MRSGIAAFRDRMDPEAPMQNWHNQPKVFTKKNRSIVANIHYFIMMKSVMPIGMIQFWSWS